MNIIEQCDRWANSHPYIVFDGLRILLGLFIFYKGLFFIQNTDILLSIIQPVDETFNSFWLTHYVAMAHLVGGVFITVGLLTRFCAVVQLPVLIGAVIINFMGTFEEVEFIQSLLILVLLLFFTFYGSGRYSADHFFGIGVHS